jgi:hypothetical protein
VGEVLAAAREFTPLLEAAGAVLAELDAVASMAAMIAGLSGPFVRPTITPAGQGDVVIKGEEATAWR